LLLTNQRAVVLSIFNNLWHLQNYFCKQIPNNAQRILFIIFELYFLTRYFSKVSQLSLQSKVDGYENTHHKLHLLFALKTGNRKIESIAFYKTLFALHYSLEQDYLFGQADNTQCGFGKCLLPLNIIFSVKIQFSDVYGLKSILFCYLFTNLKAINKLGIFFCHEENNLLIFVSRFLDGFLKSRSCLSNFSFSVDTNK